MSFEVNGIFRENSQPRFNNKAQFGYGQVFNGNGKDPSALVVSAEGLQNYGLSLGRHTQSNQFAQTLDPQETFKRIIDGKLTQIENILAGLPHHNIKEV